PTFGYSDDAGRQHAVWFLDAVTLHNQLRVADGFRPMGYALWRMGGEDPLTWTLLRHPFGALKTDKLSDLVPGQDVDFDGTGEVLRVSDIPRPGHRTLTVDPGT